MIEGARNNMAAIGGKKDVFEETKVTADAGFHSETNMYRGKGKVDAQWKLFSIVPNLLEVHRLAFALDSG